MTQIDSQMEPREGATGDPVEWWYINALLQAPGTPFDGWALVTTFLRFGSAIEEGRFLLIPPSPGNETIDFGTRRLALGTLKMSGEAVDVSAGDSYLRGGYPEWELAANGVTKAGEAISATLQYKAQLPAETLTHVWGQIGHIASYRVASGGTISLGGHAYDVSGIGFYERVHGSLGWEADEADRHHVAGWNWYWSPRVGNGNAAVETWSFFTDGGGEQPSPFISISLDGETFKHFSGGRREVLEEREMHGVPYPHVIRLVDNTGSDTVDITITRRDVDARSMTGPGRPKRMYFITGYSDFTGSAVIDGREVSLEGTGFGSAYEMSTDWS